MAQSRRVGFDSECAYAVGWVGIAYKKGHPMLVRELGCFGAGAAAALVVIIFTVVSSPSGAATTSYSSPLPTAQPPSPPKSDASPITSIPVPMPASNTSRSNATSAVAVAPCPEKVPADMVCVPGGPFLRGIDVERAKKLGPQHFRATPQSTVSVSTFLLDRTEVTVDAWRKCEAAGPCRKGAGPSYQDFDAPKQPIAGVSWFDARTFCIAQDKRLPTEAEWEKAVRGTDGRMFPWGDEPATCERAVYKNEFGRSCGIKQKSKTHADVGRPDPVASRPADPIGTYDLAGNSWEWVNDWFSPSWKACGAACEGMNPQGPCGGKEICPGHTERVVRGGSWYWPADHMATWFRRPHLPANTPVFHHFGFRCARSL